MELLVHSSKYGTTSTIDPTKMGYYVVKFISNTTKLQKDNTTVGQVFKVSKLVAKAEDLISIKPKTS